MLSPIQSLVPLLRVTTACRSCLRLCSASYHGRSFKPTTVGETVVLGNTPMSFGTPGSPLQPLTDCNSILHDRSALLQELDTKGYLFIRQLHCREEVLNARLLILQHIEQAATGLLDESRKWEEGVQASTDDATVPFLEGKNDVTHSTSVLQVLEGHRVASFFSFLFGEEPLTFDFKWLRVVPKKAFTGAHVDNVYMSRGSSRLLTIWTPLGDTDMNMGTVTVCEGSTTLPSFSRMQETYSSFDVEKGNLVGTGWLTTDPLAVHNKLGGVWKSADFRAGDVLVFGMRTLHMSTQNVSGLLRLSCDTRWQPRSERADPRYVGDAIGHVDVKFGLHAPDADGSDTQSVTMEQKCAEWGLMV